MTRQEAEAFLARNPRIAGQLQAVRIDTNRLDYLYWFYLAENEEDALINICEVVRALSSS